jgi:hypothetical protein
MPVVGHTPRKDPRRLAEQAPAAPGRPCLQCDERRPDHGVHRCGAASRKRAHASGRTGPDSAARHARSWRGVLAPGQPHVGTAAGSPIGLPGEAGWPPHARLMACPGVDRRDRCPPSMSTHIAKGCGEGHRGSAYALGYRRPCPPARDPGRAWRSPVRGNAKSTKSVSEVYRL